jgi:pimeloyl-ACP methyl ester carboxylesterase
MGLIERMAVDMTGEGDAVIMVHGLGGTSNTYTPQLSVLAARCRVIRPDLPGSGRSPTGSSALSIAGFVEALARLAAALGITKAHFVGHSLGTIILQHLAVAHPALVRSLALLGPFAAPPDAARKGLRVRAAKARADGMAPIADAIVAAALSADSRENQPVTVALVRETVMRQDPEGYARTCEALAEVTPADLSKVSCPTMLATGDEDNVAPASGMRAMAERIAGARTSVLAKCGHWSTFERAREVNQLLKEFYSGRT